MSNAQAMSHSSIKIKLITGLILASFITLIVMMFSKNNIVFEEPDHFVFDWKASLFSTKIKEQRKDIALVYVDNSSIVDYPYNNPIDRGLLATIIRDIDSSRPKAIGLDIIFDSPTEVGRDEVLRRTIATAVSPIVLIGTSQEESGVSAQQIEWQDAFLKSTGKIISNPFLHEESSKISLGDAVVRTFDEYEHNDTEEPFSLAMAHQVRDVEYHSDGLIDWLLPSDSGLEVFPTFIVPRHQPINNFSQMKNIFPDYIKSQFRDKVVIIGGMIAGTDWHRIPMTISTGLEVPGAYIHAQMLAQLLDGRKISKASFVFSSIVVFIATYLLYLAVETIGEKHPEIIFEFLVIIGVVVFGTVMFDYYRINFPSAELGLAWLLVALTSKYATNLAFRFSEAKLFRGITK